MTLHEILAHPLMLLFITIGSYVATQEIQKKTRGHSLANPVLISIAVVVIYLVTVGIPYEQYLDAVNIIHMLLGPATVALAIPLYNQLPMIKKSALALSVSIGVSCFVAAGSAFYLAYAVHAPEDLQFSIISKSATTAIAIGIAEKIGASAPLAVFFVMTTGIIGSLIATGLFKIVRIKDERAIGLALGTACHGLGVARAFQRSQKTGAFAALGMSLMGIISGIALPAIVLALR